MKGLKGFFKGNGFNTALFSCLGVVIVIAFVVSFNNLRAVPKPDPQKGANNSQFNVTEIQPAGKSNDNSYLTPEDKVKVSEAVTTENNKVTNFGTQKSNSETASNKTIAKEQPSIAKEPIKEVAVANVAKNKEVAATDNAVEPAFKAFDNSQKMTWPLDGDIVRNYSMNNVAYDKTLDLYRMNNFVSIGANVGTQVKAAADGIVESIYNDDEKGKSVVINHGNGWKTTYSQLQDNVLVKDGQVVKLGQVIGGVANPTKYSILLGGHVDFEVTKDDAPTDPKTIMLNGDDAED